MHSANDSRPALSRRQFVRVSAGALAAPLLLGCGGDSDPTEPQGPGSPRLTARPGNPSVTPQTGSTLLGLGGSRDGLLYVPTTYNPAGSVPLFVALHGAGGRGSDWSSYDAIGEARGMVVLAPDSRDRTWDLAQGGYGPDVAFLDDALEYTFERCRIDPQHIALGGFSDGASYALSLGVSNGDLFTHLVAYSPGFYLPGVPVGRPRVFVSHGSGDTILPVTGMRDLIVPQLNSEGYDVVYQEFDGGHLVPATITGAALDWFL